MWADEHALAALDAQIRFPDWYGIGDAAFLVTRCAARVGAIHRHGTDRKGITATGNHFAQNVAHEIWRTRWDRWHQFTLTRAGLWNLDLMQMLECAVHGGEILLHDRLAALAVGLANRAFDFGNRFVSRQHTGEREKAGLHHRVDAATHASLKRHAITVDHVKVQFLLENGCLN